MPDENVSLVASADLLHNMGTIKFAELFAWKKRAEDRMKIFSPIEAKCGNIRIRSGLARFP